MAAAEEFIKSRNEMMQDNSRVPRRFHWNNRGRGDLI